MSYYEHLEALIKLGIILHYTYIMYSYCLIDYKEEDIVINY